MKYLITGIAGLLGSRLADWISENTDNEVVGVDDLSGGYIENVNKKVKFYKFNLVGLSEIEGLFNKIYIFLFVIISHLYFNALTFSTTFPLIP